MNLTEDPMYMPSMDTLLHHWQKPEYEERYKAWNARYDEFLRSKKLLQVNKGIDVDPSMIHPKLFPFQRDITHWAIRKGRAAIFADTGLGKTFMQLEWARLMGGRSLIIAPLSVARQTVREAKKISLDVHYTRSAQDVTDGINITNYEHIEKFPAELFRSVVLDESSILKSLEGKTRRKLVEQFEQTQYKLCCTATPAPNDRAEIGNHSHFLGIHTVQDMLAMFFVHDEMEWRLKGHAKQAFFKWLASWTMSIRKPSDLGYSDDGYDLPPLNIKAHFSKSDYVPEGELFFTKLSGIQDRTKARRTSIDDRMQVCARLVKADKSKAQWIIWCGLNEEADTISAAIPGAVQISGAESSDEKAAQIEAFQDGKFRILVTKAKIAGFGLNLQNSSKMAFLGMGDSYEQYYQCIRRSYRFGQTSPVDVHIILSEPERGIYRNVQRKEKEAREMMAELIQNVQSYEKEELATKDEDVKVTVTPERDVAGEGWHIMQGDSCKRVKELKDESVHFSVYSPPFADLYTYSASEKDLGNSKNWPEFFGHFGFLIEDLLRVTLPGRLTAVHTSDIPAMAVKDGFIGFKDFPGHVIEAYQKGGWIFHGRITIDKDPQAQAIRTKSKGLLFTQVDKDSSWSRPALADYILLFRKDGDNPIPIQPVKNGELTRDEWIQWARPVWYGVRESDTLQYRSGKGQDDEKHICPLQLPVIERCIRLWSNRGETVLTPFMGIGSEVFQAVKLGRRGVGIELKPGYFNIAERNVRQAEHERDKGTLFEEVG